MTPPAATVAPPRPQSVTRPRTAPPRARRTSGPARPVASGGTAVLAPSFGLRLAQRAASLPDARLLDHLARGRLWIAVLGVALVGIVFLQISLLKLNTGISRAVQTEQTLERQNTELKLDLSRLGGGERIQDSAAARGFVLPATGQPRFLDARSADAERAARNVTTPAPVEQLPLGMIAPGQGGTAGVTPNPVAAVVAPEPAPAAPAGTAQPDAVAPADAPVAAAATVPAPAAAPAEQPAPTPAATAPPATAPAATAPPVAAAPAAGGAAAVPEG